MTQPQRGRSGSRSGMERRYHEAAVVRLGGGKRHDAGTCCPRVLRDGRIKQPVLKFLHAADVHLDSPLRGLERYEGAPVGEIRGATRRALENLVDLAVSEEVDLLNVGLLHTSLDGRPGHAPYAPCTVDGLRSKGYQYWALDHVHEREVVCRDPWIVFPGIDPLPPREMHSGWTSRHEKLRARAEAVRGLLRRREDQGWDRIGAER